MATIYEKTGDKIRKLRKQKGLTQEELADLAKVDPKSIISIEAGKRNVTLKTLKKIALALDIQPSVLLES